MTRTVSHIGKVVAHMDGRPLIGAHIVRMDDTTIGTTTDFDGNFRIEGQIGDRYRIGHLGFSDTPVTLKEPMPERTYRLLDSAIQLDEFIGTPKKKTNYALGLLAFGAALFIGNKLFN